MLGSFSVMLICFLYAILEGFNNDLNEINQFYVHAYMIFGPFEIITPLLFFIFVRIDWSDPREIVLKKY